MTAISPGMLQLFSMGMGAVSSTVSGIAQYKQGKAEQAAYNANAEVALQRMREQESESERKYSQLMSTQRSLYAKAGVDLSSGSPLLVLADTAMQESIEQNRIHTAGTNEAELQRFYGRQAAYRGKVGMMSTFLTSLGKAATDFYEYKKGKEV